MGDWVSTTTVAVRAGKVRAFAAFALVSVLSVGCAHTLVSQPIERHGDGWTITLQRLTDGPNTVQPSGNTRYVPERGQRFLHATLVFRNDAPQARKISYDACDLDLEQQFVVPGLVMRARGIATEMDKTESYAPGETSWRMLTFSYPEGRYPTRIRCAYVTFELAHMSLPK